MLSEVEAVSAIEYEGEMVEIRYAIDGEKADSFTLTCTADHPFWIAAGADLADRPLVRELPARDSWMTPSGRWTEAKWLRVGDRFLTKSGGSPHHSRLKPAAQYLVLGLEELDLLPQIVVGGGSEGIEQPLEESGHRGIVARVQSRWGTDQFLHTAGPPPPDVTASTTPPRSFGVNQRKAIELFHRLVNTNG